MTKEINAKTFDAIEKLKEVELELHRLKNALEMANRALDAQREWQGLTRKQLLQIWGKPENFNDPMRFARAIEAKLKEKNND